MRPDNDNNASTMSEPEKTAEHSIASDGAETPPANTAPDVAKPQGGKPPDDPGNSKGRAFLLMFAVFVSMFLVALDRTIISTAIPRITDEFDSLPDVGWYGSAYLLTCCAFQLLFGKIYAFFPIRYVLLGCILLFEAASALCGAAPNSDAFIVGRAISGVGAAGIFAGTIMSVVYIVPLEKRPKIQGAFGALFGIASIIGPLVGGAFTSNVTWRWCFYINLPIGGAAMVIIALFLKVPDRPTTKLPLKQKLAQLDLLGATALIPGIVCLILALQWGGQLYAWNNGRIIALLVVMAALLVTFVAIQILLPKTAMVPPRLFKGQRSVAAGFWSTLCVGSSQYIFIYFLPIWFQAIKGASPVNSGIRLLPLMLSMVIATIAGGILNSKIGFYYPFGLLGSGIMCIGAGLLYTFQVDTSEGKWIGFQILYGFGMGLCFQVPNLAVQTVLVQQDVPMGLALMFFGQLIGAAIFVSVGENVLSNQLLKRLAGVPGFSRELITSGGVTSVISSLPEEVRGVVLNAYNLALRRVFLIGLVLCCLSFLGYASLELRSVKGKQGPAGPGGKANVPEEKAASETPGAEP